MPEPTDHRADAERFLTDAEAAKTVVPDGVLEAITAGLDVIGSALIGIGHALLAQLAPVTVNASNYAGIGYDRIAAAVAAEERSDTDIRCLCTCGQPEDHAVHAIHNFRPQTKATT